MQQEDPKAEILEALRMTDKQKKGYILASELRTKLTGLGEKLTDEEGTAEYSCTPRFIQSTVRSAAMTSELRFSSLKSLTHLFPVWIPVNELFKEANVGPDGLIRYEEFTRMVTLPPVDYWRTKQEVLGLPCVCLLISM